MLILSRVVRFTINPPLHAAQPGFPDPNGYGGIPAMVGLGRYFELNVRCRGEPDAVTGYLVNIKDLDAAVRDSVVPRIADACNQHPETDPASLLPELLGPLDAALRGKGASCAALRWQLTPYYSVEMTAAATSTILLRQKFDFAASHRLHIPALSEEENRKLFGKCNNAGGHGHNYQFEPCIALQIAEDGRPTFTLAELERLAHEAILRRFDHKHLNLDTPEFNPEGGGVNPTVENIAMIFHDLLAAALREAGARADLRSMTVWETDRTSATYPG